MLYSNYFIFQFFLTIYKKCSFYKIYIILYYILSIYERHKLV